MIHQGRVVLDGTVESVRAAHHRSQVRYANLLDRPPVIDGALSIEGEGRSWNVIHNGSPERFSASVALQQGEVLQSREATLEEVFVARVGRTAANPGPV